MEVEIKIKSETWKIISTFKKKEEELEFANTVENLMSPNEVSENVYKKIETRSTSIAMVAYMEPQEYQTKLHIPQAESPSPYPEIIKAFLQPLFENIEIDQILVGHEHGDKNKKCHLQIAITFAKEIRKILKPGKLTLFKENCLITSLIFMQQKTRNNLALQRYCEKEGDFSFLNEEKKINYFKKKNGKVDPFLTIANNEEKLNPQEALKIVKLHDPLKYYTLNEQITKSFNLTLTKVLTPFEWKLPTHLESFTISMGEMRFPFMPIFLDWFNTFCKPERNRRVALCLYSKARALGKSMFARSLVNSPEYLLEFNNTFSPQNFENKKLLLLDDMQPINETNITCWSSLVASQDTTIRGAWVNKPLRGNLPCIITTNSKQTLTIFTKHPLFNTQVIVIEIDQYMGPPGTNNSEYDLKPQYLGTKTKREIDEEEILQSKEKNIFGKTLSKLAHLIDNN